MSLDSSCHTRLLAVLGSGAFIIVVLVVLLSAVSPSSGRELATARDRLLHAGSYRFTADIDQTVLPRGVPEMIGAADEHHTLSARGEVVMPGHATLTLRAPQQMDDALTLLRHRDQTFLVQHGVVQPTDTTTATPPVPTLDFLGYLDAAEDVRALPPQTRDGVTYQRYRFTIEGVRLADQLRQQVEQQIGATLPPGAQTTAASQVAEMGGQGEVWIDPQGMLTRQVLDLHMPHASAGYNAEIHLDIRLYDVGAVQTILEPVQTADGTWHLITQSVDGSSSAVALTEWTLILPPEITHAAWIVLLLLSIAGSLGLWWRWYHRAPRQAYLLLALSMIGLLVGTPLAQQVGMVQFAARTAAAAEQQSAPQEMQRQISQQVAGHPALRAGAEQVPGLLPTVQQNTAPASVTVERCGDGAAASDSDRDGLSDREEGCLGTDAYAADTDFDFITDTLELEGLTFAGTTWTLDPFKADSNGDGLNDGDEWLQPVGTAPSWDGDNDRVPNPWDEDNDNDGVSDGFDLAPYSASTVRDSFALQTTNAANIADYQYIDIQVQPENLERLRYTSTPLNWPNNDNAGQITDLNDSADDLSLVPLLEIETNIAPDEALAQNYGVSVFEQSDGSVKLYAPLYTVVDNGQITTFQTKVVYGPNLRTDIQWDEVRLIWAVSAQVDQYVRCPGTTSTTCVTSDSELVQTYPDRLRVAGIQITRSGPFEMTLFGTPQSAEDDAVLMQLLSSLNVTFLAADRLSDQPAGLSMLETLAVRFNSLNTLPTQKFEIDQPVTAAHQTYAHYDEAVADITQVQTVNFLNRQEYLETTCQRRDGTTFPCASLVLATEENIGVISLDEFGGTTPDFDALTVNFAANLFPRNRVRSLRLNPYEQRGGEWRALDIGVLLDIIDQRYDLEQIAADLQDVLPGITADDLQYVTYVMYLNWVGGQRELAGIDGQSLLDPNPDAQTARTVLKTGSVAFGKVPDQTIKLFFNDFLSARRIEAVNFDELGEVLTRKQLASEVTNFRTRLAAYRTAVRADRRGGTISGVDDIVDIEGRQVTIRANRAALARTSIIGIGRAAYIGGGLVVIARYSL